MNLEAILGLAVFVGVMVWFGLRFPDRTPTTTPSPDELREQLNIPPDERQGPSQHDERVT